MNYDERIAALTTFKSLVSGAGETTDDVAGVSSEVSGWEGQAKTKFDEYIETIKSDTSSISGRKTEFLAEVDGQISKIKTLLENEVAQNKYIVSSTYDKKDSGKNKTMKRQKINGLSIDDSSKKKATRYDLRRKNDNNKN
ncbi:hypothetical protein MX003_00430 [Streptococcus uberis]|uniref:hypothetical protein n=1 Tax=Streptococcus uberis TaxID=1349 RepID=UPI0027DE48B2|nr:hypothetical protein [Streptococcus uberis]MCK1209179.1 hypothetical protein [Streptococcus uberis]MCK1236208.1 hypothetical protein [Streptococcus uberis]